MNLDRFLNHDVLVETSNVTTDFDEETGEGAAYNKSYRGIFVGQDYNFIYLGLDNEPMFAINKRHIYAIIKDPEQHFAMDETVEDESGIIN